MKITIDSSILNTKILKPLGRIVDDCVLTITDSKIESIASVASGSIIIYVTYDVETDIEDDVNLNIKDISKLTSVLNCINSQMIDMTITPNNINYKTDSFKFKFHLTEDGVITVPKLKKEKLNNIETNTTTILDAVIFNDILKASSFIKSDDVKLYFYTQNNENGSGLYCDITNKTIMNSDIISIKLSDEYEGDDIQKELICDVERIRQMNITRDSNITLSFNTDRGFTIFDLNDDHGRVRYILPTLSK